MREADAGLGDLLAQGFRELLHVLAVQAHQHLALDLGADLDAVGLHFRALGQHVGGDDELFVHDRCRAFFLGQFDADLPAHFGHDLGHFFGESQ